MGILTLPCLLNGRAPRAFSIKDLHKPGIVSLQQRIRRLATLLDGGEALVSPLRIERMTSIFQRWCGDAYWSILDAVTPNWLEDAFEGLGLSGADASGRSSRLGRHSAQINLEDAEEGVA